MSTMPLKIAALAVAMSITGCMRQQERPDDRTTATGQDPTLSNDRVMEGGGAGQVGPGGSGGTMGTGGSYGGTMGTGGSTGGTMGTGGGAGTYGTGGGMGTGTSGSGGGMGTGTYGSGGGTMGRGTRGTGGAGPVRGTGGMGAVDTDTGTDERMGRRTTAEGREDTTARNARTPTAQDQSNEPKDLETTRQIRQAVMGSDVSFGAKNVTIITRNGQVTLTGNVASQREKDAVLRLARGVAGATQVTDELTVSK